MPLTDGQVGLLRARVAQELVDACSIQTYTQATDNEGGQADTWATTQINVPCHVAPAGIGIERIIGERLSAEVQWVVRLAHDATISVRDKIIWDGRPLEVRFVGDRTRELGTWVAARETS